ncbi:recombinase family protein [Rhodococcus opacus]|uniref:recombinase family protein n=1 Tax=Rhodococcus opacus TaxID=37919 RepID=UPI00155A4087|nr:recombinase family protein [Rhodococcus opacus]
MSTNAVIYVRVSKDDKGTSRSVGEQEKECRLACERRGWRVVEVLEDNDLSASRYARKGRPGYETLLDDLIPSGTLDYIVTWEQSRIARDDVKFGFFQRQCEKHGVAIHIASTGQTLDPDDMAPKILAIFDAEVSAQTSRRVRRALLDNAENGKPHGKLPYGYVKDENGSWQVDPVAAAEVRDMVAAVLDGATLYGLGRKYHRPARSIRSMLLSPAYAGILVQNGKAYQGSWPPILDVDTSDRVRTVLMNPLRRKTSTGPKAAHLLTGIGTCGKCQKPLRYARPKDRPATYRCPDGHVSRKATVVEDAVEQRLFDYFADQIFSRRLFYADDRDAVAAADRARELRQRLDGYVLKAAQGKISDESLELMEATLGPQIEQAREEAQQMTVPVLRKFAGVTDPREVWDDLTLAEQRDVIRETLLVSIPVAITRDTKGVNPRSLGAESVVVEPRLEACAANMKDRKYR